MKFPLPSKRKNPQKYSKFIIRMGGFHIATNFMGAIGFLMKNSGIEDILAEAEICHHGTANKSCQARIIMLWYGPTP